MPEFLENTYRHAGLSGLDLFPNAQPETVTNLLTQCPAYEPTALLNLPELASQCGIAKLWVKDERTRMGLGSFKALGAAYAIARDAAMVAGQNGNWSHALKGRSYVTASAGNHGLSVAAGAQLFGARAIVYLAETVPDAFAGRLVAKGAQVRRAGANYEESMAAAEAAAEANGWTLLSDSTWPGYTEMPLRVMEGYLQLSAEVAEELKEAPTHILLQAGVGGMAAAIAAHARSVWGDGPVIIVVEPDAAPALTESIRAGRLLTADGPVSSMGRLDCKTPSLVALAGLARDADLFVTISEEEAARGVRILKDHNLGTTPSGAAGLAALLAGLPSIGKDSRVLAILSECEEDA